MKKQLAPSVKAHLIRGAFYLVLLVSVSTIPFALAQRQSRGQRTLTFAQRVAYQHAIEEVYWRHRIWPKERKDPKPSLDVVMSQSQLEKKVADYLRNSQALDDYWQRPITSEQLQAEMNRMAQHTKQPEGLGELFEALSNDPFLIAECLARPALAERLLTNLYTYSQTLYEKKLGKNNVSWVKEPLDSWLATTEAQVRNAIAVPVYNYRLPQTSEGAGSCIDGTWTATAGPPDPRDNHTAVWTGTEMIIWGGGAFGMNTGGRYNPSTDTWIAISTTNAPSARYSHTAVWTGTEMIIWGGGFPGTNTGGRYNPVTDSWIATSTTNAPTARVDHRAVWTGNEMIVWGGARCNSFLATCLLDTGGRYIPAMDNWTATSTSNAPSGRVSHTAVWTGTEMVVWGGGGPDGFTFNSGGRYNPSTNSWIPTSTTDAPLARSLHTAVWTGSEMIVWGGVGGFIQLYAGGRHDSDPASPPTPTPTPTPNFNTGARYNPDTDSWIATSTTNAPSS